MFSGQIYGLIVRVMFMGHVYDRVYWIGFRAEFTGPVCRPSLQERIIGRVH